ncbi:MAG TPA: LemA family protein, partial [Rhodobiaceae bacterium]|nr:LemA family protein [Rhodobiaceae bacterium]
MDSTWIFLIIIGVVAAIGYSLYVSVIQKRNRARNAFSTIDVQLKKRHDLIPNVLKIAKETMKQEMSLIEEVTRLRTATETPTDTDDPDAIKSRLEAESGLAQSMRQLFAVAENYPEPRFVEAMKTAQETYQEVEGHIS